MRPRLKGFRLELTGALAILTIVSPLPTRAQATPDSLRAQLERLASQVDSLSEEVARLRRAESEASTRDELDRLRAAAAAAAAGAAPTEEEDQEFVGQQRSLQALNPEISVNADVFGQVDKDDAREQNFFAREFEISLVSNLDPFSRAKIFVSRHEGGGEISPFPDDPGHDEHGGGFGVEEGYVEWVGLPGGIGLKLGKFYQQFGQLNRWHAHALPSQARSLPHLAYIGEEALTQTGASIHWLAPFGGGVGVYEATVELTRSENEVLFGSSGRPAVLGHLNAFWSLSPALDLDLGLSWMNGSYEDETAFLDRNLLGAEVAFTWRPPERSLYRGFALRAGVMALDGLLPVEPAGGGTPEPLSDRAWGYWGAGELRLSQRWLVGARADRVESPMDPTRTAWLAAPTLTWWQSEYVRLRLEYDVLGRSHKSRVEGRLLLQVTFAMGPHKHESY
ncbi:MAG TPA: hypothetical protein VLA09_08335 [Longimicrobiales bacterium]|nr:hypothetical protein [Longimicrobiales bacterium]